MLNPLNIQNLQSSSGKTLTTTELTRALPLNTPTQVRVTQSTPHPTQPKQFMLQVQLGSSLYQLNTNQSLPAGSSATLTRTDTGQLQLKSANSNQATPGIKTGAKTSQSPPSQQLDTASQAANKLTSQAERTTISAILQNRLPTELNRQLALNRPVLATVERPPLIANGNNQAPQNSLLATVRINNQAVKVLGQQQIPQGQALLLRTGSQQIELQPLSNRLNKVTLQQQLNTFLRESLPHQQPVANVLQQLQTLSTQQIAPPGDRSLQSIISSLIIMFGVKTDASSDASSSIKRNIENGGLFTERQIATSPGKVPDHDMKAQLGKLAMLAEKLPDQPRAQLLELIKGLFSRVTSQQLESIQNTRSNSDGGIERFFTLDLPIRHGETLDNVELKIAEHRQTTAQGEMQSLWKVRLHFDFDRQGTIEAEIVLENEHQITAHFWCSNQNTATAMDKRLDQFNDQLVNQGFVVSSLHCIEGSAPKSRAKVQQLIDITT